MEYVYRVEDDDGIGPYHSPAMLDSRSSISRLLPWQEKSHMDDEHPTPFSDSGIGFIKLEQVCGFGNAHELRKWFSEKELLSLHKHGFFCSVYIPVACSTVYGQRQVVFEPKERVKTIALTEI